MRKMHVSERITRIIKRGRGRFGISLLQLFKCNLLDYPLVSMRSIPAPIDGLNDNRLPLEYDEVLYLFEPGHKRRSVADVIGLSGMLTYYNEKEQKEMAVKTEDWHWLAGITAGTDRLFFIKYDKSDDVFHNAVCLTAAIRYTDDIQFINTRRGDIYIRCKINGKELDAVRMKRTDSRIWTDWDTEFHYKMVAKYYADHLWQTTVNTKI